MITTLLIHSSICFLQNAPGVVKPLGFFDPLGFSKGVSEDRVRFYQGRYNIRPPGVFWV